MYDKFDYKTVGMHKAIFCASVGLLIALIINLLLGTIVFAFRFPEPIITGIIGLYICAYFYGTLAGKIIYRVGVNDFKIWLIGVLLAWSCVITMSIAGSSVYFFKELNLSNFGVTFIDYVFKPLFWIVFFGFVPALVLGLIWAKQVKKEFRISN